MLRAGAAKVPLEAPHGIPMFGYGAREGVAEGTHDALYARALYLAAGQDVLLVEADLCLLAPAQADALRERIARRTGVPVERILVGCIHTHSGPEPGYLAWLGRTTPPAYAERILSRLIQAAERAHADAVGARLGLGRTEVRIGRNRRVADAPIDPSVWVLRVDRSDGTPLAVTYLHGCHPTVLGHENLHYSADWPGAASALVDAAFPGATAIFALSAHADVDPRCRGVMDLALDGQSRGSGFEVVETLGSEVGRAVVEAAARITVDGDVEVRACSSRVAIPVHGCEAGEDAHRRHLQTLRCDALAALDLDPEHDAGTGELFNLIRKRTQGLPDEEVRTRVARVRRYLRDHTAPRFAGGHRPEVEIQLLRLGELRLLAIPAEPTVEVGLDWRARMGKGPSAIHSIANGWLRYLPHRSHFETGARDYEVLMSTLVPDAAERILTEGEELAHRLASS